jgi:hypothetical protein
MRGFFFYKRGHTQRTHTYFLVLNFVHCVLYPIHVCLVTGTTRRSTAQPRQLLQYTTPTISFSSSSRWSLTTAPRDMALSPVYSHQLKPLSTSYRQGLLTLWRQPKKGEKNVWMNHATWISYRSPFSTFLSLLGLVPQSLIAGNIPLIWWLVPAVNLGIPLPRWHSWLYRKLNDKVFNHSTHVLLAGAIRKPRGVAKLSFEKLQIQSRTGN